MKNKKDKNLLPTNAMLTAGHPKYENLKADEVYMYNNGNDVTPEWVKAKIHFHWRGQPMVELLEGRLKGKWWYLFPTSMERLLPCG